MSAARQRAEWQRVGVLVWGVRKAVFSKEPLTPETIVPEAYRAEKPPGRELTEGEKQEQRRRFWARVDKL